MTLASDQNAAPPAAPPATFDAIPLSADVRKAIDALGYVQPTPVQIAVFDPAVRGKNLVVQARTGTGKTAAFGLPIVDQLVKKGVGSVQALILTPTRELALQVARELERLAQFRGTKIVPIYGGAPMGRQVSALSEGAQVVVGTPGRVLDHLRRGTLDPASIRIFVLDEADEMLSMGFAKELNAIIETLPKERQGLYFSATIPADVERLANSHLKEPEYVTLSSDQVGALEISHFVYLVRDGDKRAALARILEVEDPESAVVFCNTREETERVAELLKSRGYDADWLNGDLDQRERERVMNATKEGKLRYLVATDVAARGIDISHLTHVVNADFPESAEQYVHRTGRTGRAGKTGTAISIVGPKDVGHLYMLRLTYKIRPIERMLPTPGELRTRAEADLVAFVADAYAGKAVDPMHLAVARRLLTHENAEVVIAGLLADHLGASSLRDPAQDAADARRAKNPPPEEKPREREPRTLREGEREARRDRREGRDGLRADQGRQDQGRQDQGRQDQGRQDQGRQDQGRQDQGRQDQGRQDQGRQDQGRQDQGRQDQGRQDQGRQDQGRQDQGRPEGRANQGRPDQRGRDRDRNHRDQGVPRRGRPISELSDWEPPAEKDDDAPLFREEGTRPGLGPNDSSDTSRRGRRGRRDQTRMVVDEDAGADAETIDIARPNLPGYHIEDDPTVVFTGRLPKPRDTGRRDSNLVETQSIDTAEAPVSREGVDDPAFMNVFLNVGRRDGLRAEDVQRLIVEKAELTEADVGHIRLRDRITFVGIRREHAERAIKALIGQMVGERALNAEPARDR